MDFLLKQTACEIWNANTELMNASVLYKNQYEMNKE